MALARASRIQEKLNSNELKSDVPIWKHSQAVLNCFKRALEIDGSNLSLWIEYGTISYALHSFASRQLKQWRNELPPEVVKQVSDTDMSRVILLLICIPCQFMLSSFICQIFHLYRCYTLSLLHVTHVNLLSKLICCLKLNES